MVTQWREEIHQRTRMARAAANGEPLRRCAYAVGMVALMRKHAFREQWREKMLNWCESNVMASQATAIQYLLDCGIPREEIVALHTLIFGGC